MHVKFEGLGANVFQISIFSSHVGSPYIISKNASPLIRGTPTEVALVKCQSSVVLFDFIMHRSFFPDTLVPPVVTLDP